MIAIFIKPEYQAEVEALYETQLLQSLANIQEAIPAWDLAIQWDLPIEIAYLEYVQWKAKGGVGDWVNEPYASMVSPPWFEDVENSLVERIVKLMGHVKEGVEMGVHLCYGDIAHKHFKQPTDMGVMVNLFNELVRRVERKIDWLHMPVPKNRSDREYFEPLERLGLVETELFLGLVHGQDCEGTRERIRVANKVVTDFGISTECGCGRCDEEELLSILDIMRSVGTD